MILDDEAIERIGAAIQSLQQSERLYNGENAPLRLYRTRDGEFVRVLDDDTAPLTSEMLRAIDAYTTSETNALVPVPTEEVDAVNGDVLNRSVQNDEACQSNTIPERVAPVNDHVKDPVSTVRKSHSDTNSPTAVTSEDGDVVIEDVVMDAMPVPVVVDEDTPRGLAAAGVSVGAWLNGQSGEPLEPVSLGDVTKQIEFPVEPHASSTSTTPPIEALMCQWPRDVSERTRLCYNAARDHPSPPRCVVYWLRTTLRVTHGNFGLAAAIELGKFHKLPVVAIYLSPSTVMYPLRHASGINDALTRWSIADVRKRLRDDHRIEMFAFIPHDHSSTTNAPSSSGLDAGSALYTLLDAFQPVAVITDEGFSLTVRSEVECLRQFLLTRVRASWSLLAVDSATCVPIQSVSECVRKSLSVETAPCLTEEEFSSEYTSLIQHRERFSTPIDPSQYQSPVRAAVKDALDATMKKICVREIVWDIVEGMNAQSASSIAAASERVGLERLQLLVSVTDERPAIQQELQGSGIMSLLPFVRHGTVFSGYVLDKLAATISSMPRPTDARSRKAFAMLKVLRSRAASQLAKERDYGLYLSLWATRQAEREIQLSGRVLPFRALSSFKTDLSELDTYKYVLPAWISPNKHLGGLSCQTPVYDPYQLESGRTDDQYWNEIQGFLIEKRYVHPLVMVYWAYRILQWSISTRAGIATIEALLDKCSLGSSHSPDISFSIWTSLFHIGKMQPLALDAAETAFVSRIEAELSAQPTLQFRK